MNFAKQYQKQEEKQKENKEKEKEKQKDNKKKDLPTDEHGVSCIIPPGRGTKKKRTRSLIGEEVPCLNFACNGDTCPVCSKIKPIKIKDKPDSNAQKNKKGDIYFTLDEKDGKPKKIGRRLRRPRKKRCCDHLLDCEIGRDHCEPRLINIPPTGYQVRYKLTGWEEEHGLDSPDEDNKNPLEKHSQNNQRQQQDNQDEYNLDPIDDKKHGKGTKSNFYDRESGGVEFDEDYENDSKELQNTRHNTMSFQRENSTMPEYSLQQTQGYSNMMSMNRNSGGFAYNEYEASEDEDVFPKFDNENMGFRSFNNNNNFNTRQFAGAGVNRYQNQTKDKKTAESETKCPLDDLTKPGQPCSNKTCPYRCRHPKI